MQRKFSFVAGELYHVYNRGIEKRTIFREQPDSIRFQNLLYLCNSRKRLVYKLIQGAPLDYERGEPLVEILGYALMPNHLHIIAKESQNGGVSTFMGKVSTAYTMYFNTKYERTGGLMCRPFRAKHILDDDYLRWLFSYVHLNPVDLCVNGWKQQRDVDVELVSNFLRGFPFSSYVDYFDSGTVRPAGKILSRGSMPIDISEIESVQQMLEEYGSFQGDPLE